LNYPFIYKYLKYINILNTHNFISIKYNKIND